jgi:ATP adenylyltransferase
MDRLFTPWRYQYVTSLNDQDDGCVLCTLRDHPERDEENFVLLRTATSYVVLNRYPYTSGHLMVVPHEHVPRLQDLPPEVLREMMVLARQCETCLGQAFRPDGFNLGMNLGRIAGAGFPEHLHLHLVPRWSGDTSFMTVTGETRVVPLTLDQVFATLRPYFGPAGDESAP